MTRRDRDMASTHPISDLTAEQVHRALHYDPETGVLTWRWREGIHNRINARFAGKPAGRVFRPRPSRPLSYVQVRLHSRLYLAHRLAWLYMTGEWPSDQIDHRNHDGTDNRWANLRSATNSQNNANKRSSARSGLRGVDQLRSGRWRARLGSQHLGVFDTPESAHMAYRDAAVEAYGDYARIV